MADATTRRITFGSLGDRPVTGDWDGDGNTDLGVFSASTATFTLRTVSRAGVVTLKKVPWGTSTSLPVAGDWNNDHIGDIGVWDPATATFSLRLSPAGTRTAAVTADAGVGPPARLTRCGAPVLGSVSENAYPSASRREPNATVPGSSTGFLNATSTVTASGSRPSSAARQRALLHMPCAICRGNPNALAVSGVEVDRVVVA